MLTITLRQIKDGMGNDHGRPKDLNGETRQAFTSPGDTTFDVCFDNTLVSRRKLDLRTACRLSWAFNNEFKQALSRTPIARSNWMSILVPMPVTGPVSKLKRSLSRSRPTSVESKRSLLRL